MHDRFSRVLEKAFSHAFFFFFSYQIFSPMLGGRTIYLEYLIVATNPFFWCWIGNRKFSSNFLLAFCVIGLFFAVYPAEGVKFGAIFAGVLFLFYAIDREIFYLKGYVTFTIAVAALQFGFVMLGKTALAYSIGPTNLAHVFWGSYATQTFTNFYTIFWFPRVSGLSREAGFLSSFIVASYLALWVTRSHRVSGLTKRSSVVLFGGLILALSRSSLAFVPAYLLMRMRRLIDHIPTVLGGVIFLIITLLFVNFYVGAVDFAGKGSIVGRFGAFAVLPDVSFSQLVMGVGDISTIDSRYARMLSYVGYDTLHGVGGWVLQYGLISYVALILVLWLFKVRTTGLLLILLFSSTVGLATNQNFVVLAYFVATFLPVYQRGGCFDPRLSPDN